MQARQPPCARAGFQPLQFPTLRIPTPMANIQDALTVVKAQEPRQRVISSWTVYHL
jgi:hypothetical protein